MRRIRIVYLALGCLAFLTLTSGAALQARPYAAYLRLRDAEWSKSASAQAQRETAHRALGLWFADPHEAFVVLGMYGDQSSIPYLRAALARRPKSGNGAISCTWTHGEEALTRLTAVSEAPGAEPTH